MDGCSSPSPFTYQYFQCLKLLSSFIKSLASKQEFKPVLDPRVGSVCPRALSVLCHNWENPSKGVPELVASALASLLDAVEAAGGFDDFVSKELFEK